MSLSPQELADRTQRLTDQISNNAETALRATQSSANATMDRLAGDIATAREKVSPMIDRLSQGAEQFTRRGAEVVMDGTGKMKERLDHLNEQASSRIQNDPIKAVVYAAAAGAALALLARWLTRPSAPTSRRDAH